MNCLSVNKKIEVALDRFQNGWSCAQVVLCSFCEDYEMDIATAKSISCGFAGGMRCGETCGAVSAAIMVIGLWSFHIEKDFTKQQQLCFDTVSRFLAAFERKQNSCKCKDILGYDIRDTEERKKHPGRQRKICPQVIEDGIQILADCIRCVGDGKI